MQLYTQQLDYSISSVEDRMALVNSILDDDYELAVFFYNGNSQARRVVEKMANYVLFAYKGNKQIEKEFNIVLITIDTLRADHLSCYGYDRDTSPNIDKIAEKGFIFNNAIAPSSWTSPSMVSLFTSVYPINHGVVHGFVKDKKIIIGLFSSTILCSLVR